MFNRDNGIRFVASIIAEIALRQHWNLFFLFEGSPTKRALFSSFFSEPMWSQQDVDLYFKIGLTFKF